MMDKNKRRKEMVGCFLVLKQICQHRTWIMLATFAFFFVRSIQAQGGVLLSGGSKCYKMMEDGTTDDLNQPQKCMPPFENVVAEKMVNVTPVHMTCGLNEGVEHEYCIQTQGIYRECDKCDNGDKKHPPSYLTDVHTEFNKTWWQSVTMLEGVHEQEVHLTVNLGKTYEITYVRLRFNSPRPASFAIYKKKRLNPADPDPYPDEDWIPWQYYSATCRDTYSIPPSNSIMQPGDGKTISEARALCSEDFSDLTPLIDGNVAFSTLDGRPSMFDFERRPELQQWVAATDIRISLKRLNTFGDEVFGDHKVLKSYYYAITDFTVGGRCQCNGHATHCVEVPEDEVPADERTSKTKMKCICQHGTDGPNCEYCLADHWDRPWKRATTENANECLPCQCNGWSTRCGFNEEYFLATGSGGECINCEGNRDGQHCERCLPDHYESPEQDQLNRTSCLACNCDPTGSTITQCGPDGKCICKAGVTGDKCDQCDANYWNFNDRGCETCDCKPEGSLNNVPQCDAETGNCDCKNNVEGKKCDKCMAGHFHIDSDNDFGCTPCFCYGHTADCALMDGYVKSTITTDFSRSGEEWTAFEDDQLISVAPNFEHNPVQKEIRIKSNPNSSIASPSGSAYFSAPRSFLGDQRNSYNKDLSFRLRIENPSSTLATPSQEDVVIIGGGQARQTKISLTITAQNNELPTDQMQTYNFRLHQDPKFGWTPELNPLEFMSLLSNITAIRIRGNYVSQESGFLDDVELDTARRGDRVIGGGGGEQANWVERCTCPIGYRGQFCEICIDGHHHKDNGGPFASCIKCNCNSHAGDPAICDNESGKCQCQHNTDGHNCEICAKGFYGNALEGTPVDCQPCPCPEGGACVEVPSSPKSPLCTECPAGRTGPRCEKCEDGYFGDPGYVGFSGVVKPCQKCNCNGNVDTNVIGYCDHISGECLRCMGNTAGFNCERCKSGFFGDALALKRPGDPDNCQPCQCYPLGTNLDNDTSLPICNGFTGDCSCKLNVFGRNCEECKDGYFNIMSGNGCETCNCDSKGSINSTCDAMSGQCFCKPGVTGLRCDQCKPLHFGFSNQGCEECACDPTGSTSEQCDLVTGQCDCLDKVEGRQCDRCMENTHNKEPQGVAKKCEPCDDCYNLVRDAAKEHRKNLAELDKLLEEIASNPQPVANDYQLRLRNLQVKIKLTLGDAKISSNNEDGGTLRDRLVNLQGKLEDVKNSIESSNAQIDEAKKKSDTAKTDVDNAKDVIATARESLRAAKHLLENDGQEALREATARSKKFGEESEKMTAIAKEARELADKQVEDASEIESIAKQAFETAKNAYDMAYNAMQSAPQTGNQIQILEEQVTRMGETLRSVQSLASQTQRDASEAYNQAIKLYQTAKLMEVPTIDDENIEKKANTVKSEAVQIKEEATRLMASNQQLLSDTQNRREQLMDLLEEAETQQKMLSSQITQLEQNREKALTAVDNGNLVLEDAKRTLETLKDFENTVTSNKQAALSALDEVDSINALIDQAVSATNEAKNAMQGADTHAQLSLNVSRDAEKIAKEASEKASIIREKAAESKDSASELSSATQSLSVKLDQTKSRLEQKEEIAANDDNSASDALEKANRAQIKAQEASMKVEKAKKELEDISAILSTVQDPEPGLLQALQRRVEAAERTYKAAELDERLNEFEAARKRQAEQMRDLQRELEYVRGENENIAQIREALPIYCTSNGDAYQSHLEQ